MSFTTFASSRRSVGVAVTVRCCSTRSACVSLSLSPGACCSRSLRNRPPAVPALATDRVMPAATTALAAIASNATPPRPPGGGDTPPLNSSATWSAADETLISARSSASRHGCGQQRRREGVGMSVCAGVAGQQTQEQDHHQQQQQLCLSSRVTRQHEESASMGMGSRSWCRRIDSRT
jgi:hypothetical protein